MGGSPDLYRPRSLVKHGDNVLGSVCQSVRLFAQQKGIIVKFGANKGYYPSKKVVWMSVIRGLMQIILPRGSISF